MLSLLPRRFFLNMYSFAQGHIAPTTAMGTHGDEFAMNFVPFRTLFWANFSELYKGEVRRITLLRG